MRYETVQIHRSRQDDKKQLEAENNRLQYIADRDWLTGLYNRGAMECRVDEFVIFMPRLISAKDMDLIAGEIEEKDIIPGVSGEDTEKIARRVIKIYYETRRDTVNNLVLHHSYPLKPAEPRKRASSLSGTHL